MKRKLFFWLDKLKITPEERITIAGLMALLVMLNLLNIWIEPTPAATPEHYNAIQKQFEQRLAIVAKQESQIMSRYYPEPRRGDLEPGTPDEMTGDTTESDTTNQSKNTGTDTINVNDATLEQLKSLPGIGPVYARRIITYRDSTNGFNTVGELIKINGIGDKRLEDIRPHVEI